MSTDHFERVERIEESSEFQALATYSESIRSKHLREFFANDGDARVRQMTAVAGDLTIDYSKQRIDQEGLFKLFDVAVKAGIETQRDQMFAGKHINTTEDRAVLHSALRLPKSAVLHVDGQDVVGDVHAVLEKMAVIANDIRSGKWLGCTTKPITHVVNIGIGGSDLGPAMAYLALLDYADGGPQCRFVSNLDPVDLFQNIADLDPASTVFVVVSKTFTTLETLTNASAARRWLLETLDVDQAAVSRHFIAVSTNKDAVVSFGIAEENMVGFWDWVGGRYSVDSAVGLSLMTAIGPKQFGEMLEGFHVIDEHFQTKPMGENVPFILGLINVWNQSFLGAASHAVLPYAQRLSRFPAYLQQLTMESNGKSVRRDGSAVVLPTEAVFWGEPGTNGQHAFYQLLHQGTRLVSCDFIGFSNSTHEDLDQHGLFMANCFAQSAVLAFGKSADDLRCEGTPEELIPHKVMPGNRPSTTILADKLTPRVLGELVALYEHTVFVEGALWGIDSFDQWGVELGKAMAKQLAPVLCTQVPLDPGADASTKSLVARFQHAWKKMGHE